MTNHYETLGISSDANEDQIKRAYRKLSLQYHPDRNQSPDAQPKFQAINEANEILGDPVRRQQYDNELNGVHPMDMMNGPEFRDINDIFKSFFNVGGMGMGMGPGPGIHVFHGGHNLREHEQTTADSQEPDSHTSASIRGRQFSYRIGKVESDG